MGSEMCIRDRDTSHRKIAVAVYGMLCVGIVSVEAALFAQSGLQTRQLFACVLLLISIYHLKTFYVATPKISDLRRMKSSIRFGNLGVVFWFATLYPWADPQLNTLLMGTLIFQFIGFVLLTGFLVKEVRLTLFCICLLYTSPSPRDLSTSRMPSSA